MLAGIEAVDHAESWLGRERRPRHRHAEMSAEFQCRGDEVLHRLFQLRVHSLARNPVDHLRDRGAGFSHSIFHDESSLHQKLKTPR